MVFLKKHKEIILLILFFWIIYSFISIFKHLHYQTFTWDTGFFDQLLWKLSRFKEPVSSFSNLHVFGDHFQFILLFFVPLYWLPQSIKLLFITHALIAVIASLPVYLISLKVNKLPRPERPRYSPLSLHERADAPELGSMYSFFRIHPLTKSLGYSASEYKSKIFALAVSFSMLIFTGFQFAVLDGFHQSVFSPLFYALAILGLVLRNSWIYWGSIFGLLITKEEMALLAVSVGLIALILKDRIKGAITIFASLAVFFFAVYFFLPAVQGEYVHSDYGVLGKTPLDVAESMLTKPALFLNLLLFPAAKARTVLESFFSFGFLPILSPIYLISAVQQFAVRFVDTVTVHRWVNLNHYVFPLASIMAVAAIFSTATLQKIFKRAKNFCIFLALYLVIFGLMQDYLFHGPVNSLLKADFYVKKQWMRDNYEVLKYIPKGASVAATNNLGPHISQRDKFYLIMEENSADYLLFDLEDSPNKYSPLDYSKTLIVFKKEIMSSRYEIIMQINNSFLLKRTDA